MPDDVGGQPLPGGEEPDNRHHGGSDDEFAAVVFDEDFVRSAEVHEPTAVERILAAAQSHAETDPRPHDRARERPYDDMGGVPYPTDAGYGYTSGYGYGYDHEYEHGYDHGYAYGMDDAEPRPYRGHSRWQRPVAWVLAVVMGIGMVALAFTAVYRGASSQRQEPTQPPPTSGVGQTSDGSGSAWSGTPGGSLPRGERVGPGATP